jgi:hypothetical protein
MGLSRRQFHAGVQAGRASAAGNGGFGRRSGAGTGNDVAAALRSGAQHVDAIEIDPPRFSSPTRSTTRRNITTILASGQPSTMLAPSFGIPAITTT